MGRRSVKTMRVAFLHTAAVHEATFDAIFAELDGQVELIHRTVPRLLEAARKSGLEAVRAETCEILRSLAEADAVVCTCSTLGPLADEVATTHSQVFRIDRPLMEAACDAGDHIIVAICLESTEQATLALLMAVAAELGREISPRVVLCDAAWAQFEAGNMQAYADEIAARVEDDMAEHAQTDCIVLAQASMRVAERSLAGSSVVVLSSPVLAAKRSIEVARA